MNRNRLIGIVIRVGLAGLLLLNLPLPPKVWAGGPSIVGGDGTGGFGPEATPFVWTASPIPYTTDGGMLGTLDNTTANDLVIAMFGVWEAVPTSAIQFNRTGPIDATIVPDGDVDTLQEFNDLNGSCTGNPIMYDADGTLFTDLGKPSSSLGFAGPCGLSSTGVIGGGKAALNGRFIDGDDTNGEVSASEFNGVFIHEFGHFIGLDHSQINLNCLTSVCASGSDDTFGLPTMFPILLGGLEETTGVHASSTLSVDDVAWVSFLYPGTNTFATITGRVLFSDGLTGVQGANVIARQVDDLATPAIDESRRNAVSVVSGYLFTGNPGNSLVNNSRGPFGSADPTLKGFYSIPGLPVPASPTAYHVEIESIDPAFVGGSSAGSLDPPIPLPGPFEFFGGESNSDDPATAEDINVTAGLTESGKDIIMNATPPRFDGFDAASRNETRATATPIGNGTHRMSLSPFSSADLDFYSFDATAGTTMTVEIVSSRAPLSTMMDSVIEILDSTGSRPATCRDPIDSGGDLNFDGSPDATPNDFDDECANDDIDLGVIQDSMLEFNPSSNGTFFVHVSEFRGDARPDFQYDLIVSGTDNTAPDISIGGAVNGASFVAGGPVGPGSIVSVFGSNLASSTALAGAVPLPTTLGGATLQINGFGVPKFFSSAGQLNIQMPWELAGQVQASMADTVGGVSGGGESVGLASFAPGLFATNQAGTSQGAILISGTGGVFAAPVGVFPTVTSRPVMEGEFIEIFCTGLGPVNNPPATGAAAPDGSSTTTTAPTVTIGGVAANVTFSGLAPGFVGLYQVNVEIPVGAPTGDAINLVLTIGGATANTVTIAVQ